MSGNPSLFAAATMFSLPTAASVSGVGMPKRDLADLEPQRPAVVHDETAVVLEPSQHGAGVLGGVAMIARVR